MYREELRVCQDCEGATTGLKSSVAVQASPPAWPGSGAVFGSEAQLLQLPQTRTPSGPLITHIPLLAACL